MIIDLFELSLSDGLHLMNNCRSIGSRGPVHSPRRHAGSPFSTDIGVHLHRVGSAVGRGSRYCHVREGSGKLNKVIGLRGEWGSERRSSITSECDATYLSWTQEVDGQVDRTS
jgi:hypothetical protein